MFSALLNALLHIMLLYNIKQHLYYIICNTRNSPYNKCNNIMNMCSKTKSATSYEVALAILNSIH